jgi:hypothetical protein
MRKMPKEPCLSKLGFGKGGETARETAFHGFHHDQRLRGQKHSGPEAHFRRIELHDKVKKDTVMFRRDLDSPPTRSVESAKRT